MRLLWEAKGLLPIRQTVMEEGLVFREKGIYRLANAGLLTGVVLFGGEGFLGIGDMNASLAAEAVMVLALLAGLNFLPLRGKFFCLSAAALGVGAAVSAAGVQETLLFLHSYFPWLTGNGGYEEWASGYAFLQAAVITLLCYLIQLCFEKMPRLKLFFAALLLVGALFALLARQKVSHLGMAFGVCYAVTVYAEWAEEHWKKVKSGKQKAYMLRIMPFLAVYLLLMACMPVPEAPYEWPFVKNIYHQLREAFQVYAQKIRWGSREGFGMSFSGFSEDGELGGDLTETAKEAMTVQALNLTPVNVYLTGTVYDTFDGRQWWQTYHGDPAGVFLDTAETLCAVRTYGGKYQRDYLHDVKLRICFRDFNTGYVFAPLKVREISREDEELEYTCEGGSLKLDQYQGYGTAYELQYYQMNGGQEEFYRFLEECSGGMAQPGAAFRTDGEILGELQKKYGKEREFAMEDVAAYRQDIYENYLGGTALSEETADYLAQITAGAETDVEKLRAIERSLSSFIYTQTPGELPGWVTDESKFLDYFLLESSQGYCTYFATAFVMLARAEGIPARYVQGFCVPVEGTGEVAVYSNMAHAWPEAYLLGAGWIPFEPTPGYGSVRYTPWKLISPDAGAEAESGGNEDAAAGTEEIQGADMAEGETGPAEEATEPEQDAEEDTDRARRFLRLLGCALPVILAGYVLLLLADNAWGRYRYQRMSGEEKFKLEVSRSLKILALLGLERGERETLQELRDRCRGRIAQVEDGVPKETGLAEGPGRETKAALAEESGQETKAALAEEPGRETKAALAEESGREAKAALEKMSDTAEAPDIAEKPDLAEVPGTAERAVLAAKLGTTEIFGRGETFGSKETPASGQLRFIENYESVIYGGRSADEDMITDAVNERHALLELLKRERRWAYVRWQMRAYLIRYR